MIDLDVFRRTPLTREPFEHLVVPRFVREGALRSVMDDFPAVSRGGSFPLAAVSYGPRFASLVAELEGPALREAVEEKFAIDLSGRPSMLTVRGRARKRDGRIHTDSRTKLITVLVYLNERWTKDGGALRLLRSKRSLDDHFVDVKPELGTAVFFRCTDAAWHGHTPFVGVRRSVQLNWVTDRSVVRREQARHGLSAKLKRVTGLRLPLASRS